MTPALFAYVRAYHRASVFREAIPDDLRFASASAELRDEAKKERDRLADQDRRKALPFGRDHIGKSAHAALVRMLDEAPTIHEGTG